MKQISIIQNAANTVMSHYVLGERLYSVFTVADLLARGYSVLRGCELSKRQRVELMGALIVLENTES